MPMHYALIGALTASVLLNAFFICRPFAWPRLYLSHVRYAFLRRPDLARADGRIRNVLKEQSLAEWFEIESLAGGQWFGVLRVLAKRPLGGDNWGKVEELTDRLTAVTGLPCWCAGRFSSKDESSNKETGIIIGVGYERPPNEVLFPKKAKQTRQHASPGDGRTRA